MSQLGGGGGGGGGIIDSAAHGSGGPLAVAIDGPGGPVQHVGPSWCKDRNTKNFSDYIILPWELYYLMKLTTLCVFV